MSKAQCELGPPAHRWNAFLKVCLRIYLTFVVAAFLVSWALNVILWEARHHAELPGLVESIPVFFLILSFGPPSILDRNARTSKMQGVRQAVFWTLGAFGFILIVSQMHYPKLFSWLPMTSFFNSVVGDTISWLLLLCASYNSIKFLREQWHQGTK